MALVLHVPLGLLVVLPHEIVHGWLEVLRLSLFVSVGWAFGQRIVRSMDHASKVSLVGVQQATFMAMSVLVIKSVMLM